MNSRCIAPALADDRSWHGRSLLMGSLETGLRDFLESPAAGRPDVEGYMADAHEEGGRGWRNVDVVVVALGTRGIRAVDRSAFDMVAARYPAGSRGRPAPVLTFAEAFRRCARPLRPGDSRRSWLDFDLDTIRGSHPAFTALQVPEWIETVKCEQAAEGFFADVEALAGDLGDEVAGVYDDEVADCPPVVSCPVEAPTMADPPVPPPPVPAVAPARPRKAAPVASLARAYRAADPIRAALAGPLADLDTLGTPDAIQAASRLRRIAKQPALWTCSACGKSDDRDPAFYLRKGEPAECIHCHAPAAQVVRVEVGTRAHLDALYGVTGIWIGTTTPDEPTVEAPATQAAPTTPARPAWLTVIEGGRK